MPLNFDWNPTVLANTGCQILFFPLYSTVPNAICKQDGILWDDVETYEDRVKAIQSDEHAKILPQAVFDNPKSSVCSKRWHRWNKCSFVRCRFTKKSVDGRTHCEVFGLELAIDTTNPGSLYSETGFLFDRRTVEERNRQASQFGSVYQDVPEGAYFPPLNQDGRQMAVAVEGEDILTVTVHVGFRSGIAAGQTLGAHIVLDIGNTRTCALFLKDNASGMLAEVESIRSRCTPILLNLPTRSVATTEADIQNVDNGIVSSWIMLHETEFDDPEEKPLLQRKYITKTEKRLFGFRSETFNAVEEQRIPTMFVRYSPVLLGKEAERLLPLDKVDKMVGQGLQIQQSSPKRYFADKRRTSLDWSMVPNDFATLTAVNASKLRSDLLYWMSESGDFVDPDEVPAALRPVNAPTHPNYPRSATFVWMVVGILERAWDQCNRLINPSGTFTPFTIKDVIVTYPSGWTRDEILLYRQACEAAVKIFERTNFSTRNNIRLDMGVDEAVASQLPLVFSEIHKYSDNAEGWFRLVGRERSEGRQTVRILNFDVGGGTSDISVVEYECLNSYDDGLVDLQPRLLFRDGYAEAGDELMRRILDKIVFPAIGRLNPNWETQIRRYFTGQPTTNPMRSQRVKVLKLCIIPLAIAVMKDMASGAPSGKFTSESAGVANADLVDFFKDILKNPAMPKNGSINMFLSYDIEAADRLIREFFENSFANAATIAANYDADLFFMSGKTSELPALEALAKEKIPLTQNRILKAKNYQAGDWYPFVKTDANGSIVDNTVRDAKSITAVGAALYFMLENGQIDNWKIEKTIVDTRMDSEWGFQSSLLKPNGHPFVFNDRNETVVRLDTRRIIARRMAAGTYPSAVYRLSPKNPDATNGNEAFEATLRRCRDEETRTEYLELAALKRLDDKTDVLSAYVLAVCQGDELFWQDSGCIL